MTMDVVRPLQAEDGTQLAPLIRQLKGADAAVDVSVVLSAPNLHVRVAERAGQVVGTATLVVFTTLSNGLQGRLEDFVVDARARSQGVGARLVKDVVELAKRLGLTQLSLTSNPTRKVARRIFERHGFAKVETEVFSLRFSQRRRADPPA